MVFVSFAETVRHTGLHARTPEYLKQWMVRYVPHGSFDFYQLDFGSRCGHFLFKITRSLRMSGSELNTNQ